MDHAQPIPDHLAEALQGVEETYGTGDGLNGVAVCAYVIAQPVDSYGVVIPAGHYSREVSDDGRHVIGLVWDDSDALRAYVDRTANRTD